MTSISIQFHATLSDLVDFIRACLKEEDVFALAVHTPFKVDPIRLEAVDDLLSKESVRSVIFTQGPPGVSGTTAQQLLDTNVGCLVLDVGRLRGSSLEESCLSAMRTSQIWKRIAADLKRRTTAGAIGRHERTGASARYRAHRFAAGARAISEQGIALRQFVSSPIVLHPSSKELEL